MLVTDRSWPGILPDVTVKPGTSIQALGFACQRGSQHSKVLLQPVLATRSQVGDSMNALLLQTLLHHLADTGNLPHIQGSQEGFLATWKNPQHAVRFRLVRTYLGNQARSPDP